LIWIAINIPKKNYIPIRSQLTPEKLKPEPRNQFHTKIYILNHHVPVHIRRYESTPLSIRTLLGKNGGWIVVINQEKEEWFGKPFIAQTASKGLKLASIYFKRWAEL